MTALSNPVAESTAWSHEIKAYIAASRLTPHFVAGSAHDVLTTLPDACVDMCMTSPPYWGQREYAGGGIGLEERPEEYIKHLLDVFAEVQRVLRPTGSFWLNIGDAYAHKALLGIPWRVAIAMTDRQGWTLRNNVIWNKIKGGMDNSLDKLRNVHEHVFHFVRNPRGYFYDVDAIRKPPGAGRVQNGVVVSATGVSGVRYRRQIELATTLSDGEKRSAFAALEATLAEVSDGKLSDFRMIIRGHQRATHSDRATVSGRARELHDKGFYILRYHPKGTKPSDVWDILPEDTQGRGLHFAPYPEDLCRIPILTTCPIGGVVLDPFCGTGTTMLVAFKLGRRSIGVDVSGDYISAARERCAFLL